jgi:hypothetical protein
VAAFPFFPGGWALGLAAVAAALTLVHARGGLALALVAPVFPLGNLSAGLAYLYVAVALCWLAIHWRHPRWALLFVWGPLLAPLYALGLLPLLVQPARGTARRALQAGAGVLAAAIVAAVEGWTIPFAHGRGRHLEVTAVAHPVATARLLVAALAERPHLALVALLLAAAAALLPFARKRGPWWLAGLAAGFLVVALLPRPELAAIPLVAGFAATCLGLALADRARASV